MLESGIRSRRGIKGTLRYSLVQLGSEWLQLTWNFDSDVHYYCNQELWEQHKPGESPESPETQWNHKTLKYEFMKYFYIFINIII